MGMGMGMETVGGGAGNTVGMTGMGHFRSELWQLNVESVFI